MPDPQLSLLGAALFLFAVCAVVMILKGLLRTLLGVAILCGSVWVGFLLWQHSPALAIRWTGEPKPWLENALPIGGGLATFLIARRLLNLVLRPFHGGGGDSAPLSPGRLALRGVSLLIPAGALWLTAATLVHHFGSISNVGTAADETASETEGRSWIGELSQAVGRVVPDAWLAWLDPVTDPRNLELARSLFERAREASVPAEDPAFPGRPIPRAIAVDEETLQDLASDVDARTLLRHPRFREAAERSRQR